MNQIKYCRQRFETSIFIFLIACQPSYTQVNSEWRKNDMDLIDSIIKLDKNQPREIERFFINRRYPIKPDTLGFGWVKLKKGIGAGYISIMADFYYFKDTIKTYILYAYLPHEDELIDEYKSTYLKFLPIVDNGKYSFKYNEQAILHPIDEFFSSKQTLDTSSNILGYMSPASGIIYGYAGGIANMTLQNRSLFNDVKANLRPNQVIEIMYSINPASRLTAIEYYLKNKKKFTNKILIDRWIEKVYKEFPKVETMSGCLGYQENSKKLVEMFSKFKR